MAQKQPKGHTANQKSFALSVLHSSSKTYILLSEIFALPPMATLKKAMKHIDIHPGFNESIIAALRMRVAAMTDLEKIVSIAFDEMSIRQGLSHDKGKYVVEGFRHEQVRGKEVANHAMAFMVRGIASKWKQPLGYFLTSGPMVGSVINILLRQCIDKLKNIGLTVVICVCGQGSNKQSLFKQLSITTKAPYVMHNSSKVFMMMFDPPHLLKNIRNNMKKYGYSMRENSISWDHVHTFYEVDTSKPIRMAPKLTKNHITRLHVLGFI